jgi:Arc/MetJ-type ribon-helix-helix transcriptional regulator
MVIKMEAKVTAGRFVERSEAQRTELEKLNEVHSLERTFR